MNVAHQEIDPFNIIDIDSLLLGRTSSAVSPISPTGNRHGHLGIQFRKKKFKRSVMFK
jgi:hypothetical protein